MWAYIDNGKVENIFDGSREQLEKSFHPAIVAKCVELNLDYIKVGDTYADGKFTVAEERKEAVYKAYCNKLIRERYTDYEENAIKSEQLEALADGTTSQRWVDFRAYVEDVKAKVRTMIYGGAE